MPHRLNRARPTTALVLGLLSGTLAALTVLPTIVHASEAGDIRKRASVPRSRSSIIDRAISNTMKKTNITVYEGTMIW